LTCFAFGLTDRARESSTEEINGFVDTSKNVSPISEGWARSGFPENSFPNKDLGSFDQRVVSKGDGTIPYLTRVMQGFSSV
jgi:hypothetical protein